MHEFIQQNPIIIKIIKAIGILLALFLLIATLGKLKEYRFIGSGLSATNTITVVGQGKVEKTPDTARVTFTIRNESRDVGTAQTTVSTKIDAIQKALLDAGIEEKYIKTDSYNSYPQYNYPTCYGTNCPKPTTPTIRGYEVSHTVTVSVKDLEKVETVLGILGQNGASEIMGPNFGFEDDKAVAREARDIAITDAKQEAQKLAKSLGVRLVRIVSFSEQGGAYPVPMYARTEAAGAMKDMVSNPSVPVGSQKVETTVNVVYEIR